MANYDDDDDYYDGDDDVSVEEVIGYGAGLLIGGLIALLSDDD